MQTAPPTPVTAGARVGVAEGARDSSPVSLVAGPGASNSCHIACKGCRGLGGQRRVQGKAQYARRCVLSEEEDVTELELVWIPHPRILMTSGNMTCARLLVGNKPRFFKAFLLKVDKSAEEAETIYMEAAEGHFLSHHR